MTLPVMFGEIVLGARDWLPVAVIGSIVLILITLLRNRGERRTSLGWLATFLKIVGILLLALCLVEPLYRGVRPRPGANAFVILTDDSQSMTVKSGSKVRSEGLNKILAKESAWRVRLEQDFDVRDYRFDEQLRHFDSAEQLTFEGVGSGLYSALDTLHSRFQSRPIAGVLVFTDGNATDSIATEKYDFPIYLVAGDDSAEMQDVRIEQMNVSQTNFEMSPISINATVASDGFSKQNLTARVVDPKGKVIEQQQVDLERTGKAELQFRFRPEASGLSFHRLEVFPSKDEEKFNSGTAESELTFANNRRWMTTDRGGGPYRVLYVAGRANWEYKFINRALAEDDEIELRGLIRVAKKQPKFSFQDRSGVTDRNQLFEGFEDEDEESVEAYDQTVFIRLGVEDELELADGFPKDADTLFNYHAIIIDDLEAKFFTAEQMLLLRRFVNQRGGGLMMLAGQESLENGGYDKTPLGEVLPVYTRKSEIQRRKVTDATSEGLKWSLTREGWLQDWTRLRASEASERKRFEQIVSMPFANAITGIKPGASLMATLDSPSGEVVAPALVAHRFGKGRAAAVMAGNLWRWGMHRDESEEGDLPQLWRQIVRWLVAEVPMRVSVTAEASSAASGAGLRSIEVSVKDEQFLAHDNAEVKIEVATPTGEKVELTAEPSNEEAGAYQVDYWPSEDGPYRVTAKVKSAEGEELPAKEAGWTTQRSAFEFQQLTTNREALDEIAKRSNGEVIDVDELDRFVASLPSRQVPVTESWTYPLWHQPWVIVLAMACLCSEWGIRRWRGLA